MVDYVLNLALTPLGRVVSSITALIASFFIWLAVHDQKIETATRTETLSQVSEGAKALDEKGNKARSANSGPGAADWLRKHACRDC